MALGGRAGGDGWRSPRLSPDPALPGDDRRRRRPSGEGTAMGGEEAGNRRGGLVAGVVGGGGGHRGRGVAAVGTARVRRRSALAPSGGRGCRPRSWWPVA